MKAAELFVKCLENEGVDYIFGLPGEENLDLMDALPESDIRFVTTRHEQGAAFMADVYGRITGRAGCCLSTLGPGATNLVTGVADANMDHAPVVAIAGQASTHRLHKESHQVLDLQSLFYPITKYSTRVLSPNTIPETVRKAFKDAVAEKSGACFIEFPENIASMHVEEQPLPRGRPLPAEAPQEKIEQAAEAISRARYPIIMAGNGVIRSRAWQQLRDFAERLNIPVANTFMAKGVMPFFGSDLSLGSVGLQSNDYVNCGFSRADVIICIGYDLVEYHPYLWHPTRDREIIHIDASAAEVDASYSVATEVVGHIKHSLLRIAELATPQQGKPMRPLRDALIGEMDRHREDQGFPVKPQKLIWDLRTVLEREDIVICDVGAHKMWMARMYRADEPNTCLISNGFAAMGIAVPGAVAAKLARPERTVVAATGDAGFLMNAQEIETAIRLNTPIVILVWNDGGYGLIEWKQEAQFGRSSNVVFGNPDLVTFAESFGARGFRIDGPGQLQSVLKEAIASQSVCIIDCPVDYRENLKLTEQLGEMACPV